MDFCQNGWNKKSNFFPIRWNFAKISEIKESILLELNCMFQSSIKENEKFIEKNKTL